MIWLLLKKIILRLGNFSLSEGIVASVFKALSVMLQLLRKKCVSFGKLMPFDSKSMNSFSDIFYNDVV